ncbi:MAG: macrolide ABC transporter permease/ATP-binding protein MacB [Rhodovulum sulfidophilum]|uniref:Pyoverdine export ATP-binding/permease protein PvdT n=1 Tax=Rhodovulum sulfidophilum TaxID=35806 RepID=A0A2W5NBL5_RHOSU|nr:MAG: macrolide ABC transporter permease/ATP-binding protein MacB [Rhodovulum sulfidophilum]
MSEQRSFDDPRRPARPPARPAGAGAPLLSLRGVTRAYPSGDETVTVLRGIDLDIGRGEMVAIMGASGSGKSTLMNILGCLDRPTAGDYVISGQHVGVLDPDALAALRREHFGFIFQRYHLLPELTALGNVEMPAIYAGVPGPERRARARELLGRLGMGPRLGHRPGQLSGGQQQRVSIARALMNDAEIILADEPTGALDSHSGEEVLRILEELHAGGRTIVLVTHDPKVAARAERVIEVSDGEIVSDTRRPKPGNVAVLPARGRAGPRGAAAAPGLLGGAGLWLARLREAFRMALLSMAAHRLRSFLTMLGIIIGIASVVNVVALGRGSQEQVLASISSLGTNTLEIFPGQDMGDVRSGRIKTLVAEDAAALGRESYVVATTPTVLKTVNLRRGSVEASAQVIGAGEGFFVTKGILPASGAFFDAADVATREQVAVIDTNTRDLLFPDGEDPVGAVILVGRMPARVIGVARRQASFGNTTNPVVWMPYTAVQTRLIGDTSLRSINLRVADDTDMTQAQQAVTALLTARHGATDFFIINNDDIRQTITSTANTLAMLVAAIAVISLVVGGIGVMNIMLVSVSERVSEIGVRLAVGGRRGDILQQFLVEAIVLCLVGGVLGILTALGIGWALSLAGVGFSLSYSTTAMLAAVGSATAIGVVFGFLPARRAARLDPVAALSGA